MIAGKPSPRSYLSDTNVRLMLRVQQGDENAFSELVVAFQDRLRNRFFRKTGDWHKAEDLTQEVFLRVYRARGKYQPTAAFATWLTRIADNLAANSMRNQRRRPEVGMSRHTDDRAERVIQIDTSRSNPDEELEQREACETVRAAVATLPPRQRLVIQLFHLDAKSQSEIGHLIHDTVASVNGRLVRARQSLRNKIRPYLERGCAVVWFDTQ